jgi:hypothetical protein
MRMSDETCQRQINDLPRECVDDQKPATPLKAVAWDERGRRSDCKSKYLFTRRVGRANQCLAIYRATLRIVGQFGTSEVRTLHASYFRSDHACLGLTRRKISCREPDATRHAGKAWMANTLSVNRRLARGQLHRLVRPLGEHQKTDGWWTVLIDESLSGAKKRM